MVTDLEYRKTLEATGSEVAPLITLAEASQPASQPASQLMDPEATKFRAIARSIQLEPR